MAFTYNLIDFVLHVDKYVGMMIENFGIFTYLILFAIIFLETGLVITPFLPGDSLIFVIGTFAAQDYLNVFFLYALFLAAAILGDTLNYWIGNYFGVNVFEKSRFFKKEYLERTKKFYRRHGKKTIILARFIPIVRTFAPFVAGIGKMHYGTFLSYNVIGGFIWVTLFLLGGYFFGNIPFVQENLTLIVYLIVLTSILPGAIEYLRNRWRR
ncbi:DedA family protein [Candidatus Pacearchaeota archaeon]|nr:DedA family protein [Candidatus Pacearchaeota archaeon]